MSRVTTDAAWPRGQALVEMALGLPVLLLVIVAGLFLGLGVADRVGLMSLTATAATAAAGAPDDATRCTEARLAIHSASGRTYGLCDGSDGLTLVLVAGPRPAVRVTILDQLAAPPIVDTVWNGQVRVTSGALIGPSPTPTASP